MDNNTSLLLKQLLQTPENTVLTSSWLKQEKGISNRLQYEYKKNGWLKSIGTGAFIKFNTSKVSIEGALHAIQQQLGIKIHVGGQFALSLRGIAHYGRVTDYWTLFSKQNVYLPEWFVKYKFEANSEWTHYKTNFIPDDIGIQTLEISNLPIKISFPERAVLELLYQTPIDVDLQEAFEIFKFLSTLRKDLLQKLLEECNSIKVKRLFLFFAEKHSHHYWVKHLRLDKINLGTGVREIVKGGVYNKRYNIVIGALDENE